MIYLDYTATTPIDEDVLNTYIKVQKNYFANTSSLHKLGQISNELYVQAKDEIKEVLKVKHNIVFTANATEANNLAIYGVVKKHPKGRIITTKIEHPSVFEVFKDLESTYDVVYLDVNEKGIISIEQLKQAMTKDTLLVSIMWVNNIIGSIQPINDVIQVVKQFPKARLHVDCVQGLTKIEPNFAFSDVDLLTFSAHKIYGPKGIAMLLVNENLELYKVLHGSSAQMGVKPGTLDVALIVAFCKAIKKYYPTTKEHFNYVKKLNDILRDKIKDYKNIVINSDNDCSPYIISLSLPHLNGETLVHMLEAKEIYVSTGSACSSKLKKPEKTVFAITNDEVLASKSIRISLSFLSKEEDILKVCEVLGEINNV